MDSSPDLKEGRGLTSSIDFSRAPTEIHGYSFGEPIDRSNYTSFLIDDFKRSRGKAAAQVYSWEWMKNHTGVDIPRLLTQFVQSGGLSVLTPEESSRVLQEFSREGRHKRTINQISYEEDKSFSSHLSKQIMDVVKIHNNQGKAIILNGQDHQVGVIDESVIGMSRDDFLKWQATDAQKDESLLRG
ncbi:MAG TPA: hypothetical protein VG965_06155 [Patescibacteria group bacterium]|nr:hypothetical protein [Patescibacteria group bacterium]